MGPRGDHQHAAQRGRQCPPAGKTALRVDPHQHQQHQRQADPAVDIAAPAAVVWRGVGRAVPAVAQEHRCPAHPVNVHGRQHGADHEFPETCRRVVERGGRLALDQRQVQREGQQQEDEDPAQRIDAPAVQRVQGERPQHVELLFDRQRPQVQQGFVGRGGVEITRFAPEGKVGDEGTAGENVFAQLLVVHRRQVEPAQGDDGGQHQEEGGENALDPFGVEVGETKPALLQPRQDDRADEVARNDEKDVHTHKTALDVLREGVVQNHRDHGDGSQTVDVRSVVGGVGARCHAGEHWAHMRGRAKGGSTGCRAAALRRPPRAGGAPGFRRRACGRCPAPANRAAPRRRSSGSDPLPPGV